MKRCGRVEEIDALYEAGFKAQFNSGIMQPLMFFVSNLIIGRPAVETVPPWTLATLRWSFACLILVPFVLVYEFALIGTKSPVENAAGEALQALAVVVGEVRPPSEAQAASSWPSRLTNT